jgi:hypothetical protein
MTFPPIIRGQKPIKIVPLGKATNFGVFLTDDLKKSEISVARRLTAIFTIGFNTKTLIGSFGYNMNELR